jgi:hypothetical protein
MTVVYASGLFDTKDKFVYIERFYMFNNYRGYGDLADENEKKALKGLGSLMFCLVVEYLVEKAGVDLNAYALLEAE